MNSDQQAFDLKNIELKELEGLARRQDLPAEVTETIRQVRQLRLGIADLEAQLRLQDQLLSDIKAEQSRIRSNMSPLNHDSELYRRYVAKLTAQEDRFDDALQAIAQSRVKLAEFKGELAKFFPSSQDAQNGEPDDDASAAGEDPFDAP
jgi:chromosome segregation ATPase